MVFIDESRGEEGNPWNAAFYRMFDMTNDSELFHTRAELEEKGWKLRGNRFVYESRIMVPLYEAKMIHFYNPRFSTSHDADENNILKGICRGSTLKELNDSTWDPLPRYWINSEDVEERWKNIGWKEVWTIVFRGVARATDERTVILSFAPKAAFGNSSPVIITNRPAQEAALLVANLSSLPIDYCARNKMSGSNLNFFILNQLPVFSPGEYSKWLLDGKPLAEFILKTVTRLTCTSKSLEPLAGAMGNSKTIHKWDEKERFELMRTLDAIYAHMYGLAREEFAFILDTFPITRDTEIKTYGVFRTKQRALSFFDDLSKRLEKLS